MYLLLRRRARSRGTPGHRRSDRFDKREFNRNFAHDTEACREAKRNLGRLIGSG
jgi:hypothetical protein